MKTEEMTSIQTEFNFETARSDFKVRIGLKHLVSVSFLQLNILYIPISFGVCNQLTV